MDSVYLHNLFANSISLLKRTPIVNALSHIAYAENDEDDQFIFGEALKHIYPSASLQVFADCKSLLVELAVNSSFRPDIIFLDLNMPGNKNFECLREIRKGKHRDLPVIIYSTTDLAPVIRMAYEYGASRFIVKPLTFTGIKEVLAECVHSYNSGELKKT